MLPALVLALAAAQTTPTPPAPEDEPVEYHEQTPRWRIQGWGGGGFPQADFNSPVPLLGLQLTRAFEDMDVGLVAQTYGLDFVQDGWLGAAMLRVEQKFETRRGIEATLSFGFGAAAEPLGGGRIGWGFWYNVALGMRWFEGPIMWGGELGFEQSFVIRAALTAGYRF